MSKYLAYKETLTKLENYKIFTYIDYLKLFIMVDGEHVLQTLNINGLYYFYVSRETLGINENLCNKFIVVRLLRVFTNTDGAINEWTTLYYFELVDLYDTEEQLLKNSRLKGFNNAIDDNEYMSAIPLVNEITHLDNGIISHVEVLINYELAPNPDNWDKFKIIDNTKVNFNFELIKMLDGGHEMPSR